MEIKVSNIKYDTDGKNVSGLEDNMILDVPDGTDIDDEIADIVSDETGWCILSCDYERIEEDAPLLPSESPKKASGPAR